MASFPSRSRRPAPAPTAAATTVADRAAGRAVAAPADRAAGVRIEASGLRVERAGTVVLDDVSLSVEPGELVAVVGPSGAGKTTLLEALAGVRRVDGGSVHVGGIATGDDLAGLRAVLGYVPQDDIIHAELPLDRTLRYAAGLRLPAGADVEAAIDRALRSVHLADRRQVRVGALSGGQRKRASIAVELLTSPRAFFLDEPTSGLDPVTSQEVVGVLRALADEGATVVFTTHAVQDLERCDRIVFLAPGGRLAHVGPLAGALDHFGVARSEEVYARLQDPALPVAAPGRPTGPRPERPGGPAVSPAPPAGALRQWSILTRRTFETLARNRLTMAILLGAPVMVVAMFAVLFRAGAFDPAEPSPSAVVMIVFWVAFGTFFFGLTYGLLQICTERAILRREHLVGLRLGPYLLSKVAVLLPFLLVVNVLMLGVLRALDRLPPDDAGTYLTVGVTLALEAVAALALGLLTSAAVANPSQATLALPMLCFPAVLFSGAIVPVHVMASVGAAISTVVPVRWTFEAIGHDLGVRRLLTAGGSPLGPPLVASYGAAGTAATTTYWAILAAFGLVFLAAAWFVLARSLRRSER